MDKTLMSAGWLQLLKLRRAFKHGDWQLSLQHNAAQLVEDCPCLPHLQLYTDIRHALTGFDDESLLQLEQTCLQQKNYAKSAMHYRVLALKRKHNLLQQNELEMMTASTRASRYPHLLARTPAGTVTGKKMLKLKSLANDLDKRCSTLEVFLQQQPPSRRYCVVGNAPTELGKTQQSAIDDSHVVFRFNRVHTAEKHQKAYGSRTDAWVISPSYPVAQQEAIARHVFVSGVSVFDKPSRFWTTLAQQENVGYYTFPDAVWYALVAKLCAPPTAGLLCIASLQKHLDPSSTLAVFGVSRDQGQTINHYGDKGKRSGRHNWPLESKMVNELLS